MNFLFIGNLGMTEILIMLFILIGPILGVFFLGYYIGKDRGRKERP